MTIVSAFLVTVLFAGGCFLLLRRSSFDLILGMALVSAGTNVLLVSMGGWEAASHPPFLFGAESPLAHAPGKGNAASYADPLPQALILTALVIGFGFLSFLMALVSRSACELEEPVDATTLARSDST